MSLDKTFAQRLEEKGEKPEIDNSRRNGKVFYHGAELIGCEINSSKYTPNHMLGIFLMYEFELKSHGIKKVKELARKNQHPDTWINFVIAVNSNRHNYKRVKV